MDYLKTATLNESESREAHAYLSGHRLLSTIWTHYAYVKPDGTVSSAGVGDLCNNCNQCGVDNEHKWNSIISVATGRKHTVGLKMDGSVVATEFAKEYVFEGTRLPNYYAGQCDVNTWSDIKAIAAGSLHTVGLKKDGSVVAAGYLDEPECNVGSWRNIVIIAAGSSHTVGLKKDGTVVATGANKEGECNVSEWTNIVDIAASSSSTFGVKSDGTVMATGGCLEYEWHNAVSEWTDIVQVVAEQWYVVGLKANGTVIVSTRGDIANIEKCKDWKDIVSLSIGCSAIIGVKKDGTLVNVSISNKDKTPFNVSGIRLFNNVNTWEQERTLAYEEWNQKKNYRSQNVCQYCGGKFKGLFSKVCSSCGQKKDY